MQADIEIHSAAKLPNRHLRREGGTGARSALKRALCCNSADWLSVSSICGEVMDLSLAQIINGIKRAESGQILIGRPFLIDDEADNWPFFRVDQETLCNFELEFHSLGLSSHLRWALGKLAHRLRTG